MKKQLKIFLKSLISAALFVYLFTFIDFRDVLGQLSNANPYWLILHVSLAFFSVLVSSWKWWFLCREAHISLSYLQATRLYFIGMFYNHFLPTSVGGDVVRGYALSQRGYSGSDSYASIFVERYTGLATLVLFVVLSLPLDSRFGENARIQLLTLFVAVAFLLGSAAIFCPVFLRFIERCFSTRFTHGIIQKVLKFQESLFHYRNKKSAIFMSFIVSFVFYANSIFVVYSGLKTLGIDLYIGDLVTAVPVMMMLFLLPISLGGIGLQEWAHTFVMSVLGVPLSIGLSLGLLFRARSILFGLLGGSFLFIKERSLKESA